MEATMPLFSISNDVLTPVSQTNFDREKQLQNLVEASLQTIFNCRFVASEFSTGTQHGGRIDTLALSEDGNPVIVEYKKIESSELINQSLYYLSWIHDHRGDFHLAAQKSLGNDVEIDWADVRVICIAPNYRKYDLHAVQVMGANLELWTYRLFKNNSIYFEEVFQKSISASVEPGTKDPVMVAAGKKAAETRRTGIYTYEQHLDGKPKEIVELAESVREFVMGLDPAMEESPKKRYVAYKISQNIICMETYQQRVLLYVKLDPATLGPLPNCARDVREVGHYGTGDLELSIRTVEDFESAKRFIELAYQNVGG
jgi:predicted transport protein